MSDDEQTANDYQKRRSINDSDTQVLDDSMPNVLADDNNRRQTLNDSGLHAKKKIKQEYYE